MAQTMRALVVTEHGGTDVLAVESRPVPQPAHGQVLIEVEASGINFKDVYEREGTYAKDVPFVLGDECAGTVRALGAGVTGVSEGERVACVAAAGAHAEYTLADAASVVPVADAVGLDTAAALLLQGMTAHYLVRSTYPVRPGDTVLAHAAAGGVGQLLVQLAKRAGATVIATVGSEAKVAIARDVGADHVIRYDEVDDLARAVRAIEADGVSVVYDGVGAATFEASLASLRPRGLLALYGAASGQVPPFDLQRLNPLGSLFVTRPTLADYVATRDQLLTRSGEVLDGTLRVNIGGRFALEDAAQAYGALEGRASTGKLLFTGDI